MKRIGTLLLDLAWLVAFALAMIFFAVSAHASGGDYVVHKFVIPAHQNYILHADKITFHYEWYAERYMVLCRDYQTDPDIWDTPDEWLIVRYVSREDYEYIDEANYHYFAD